MMMLFIASIASADAMQQQVPVVDDQCKAKAAETTAMFTGESHVMTLSVIGQGVAPVEVVSPAQAYAMARRAAIADAYRLMAERLDGVMVEGSDYVKNMIVQRSTTQTFVKSVVKYAEIADTSYRDGLCEVEMIVTLAAK